MRTSGAWARIAADLGAQRRRAGLWSPVAFGLGAQIYFLLGAEPDWRVGAGLGAAGLFALIAGLRVGPPLRLLLILAACVALGFTAAQWRTARVAAPVLQTPVTALVEGRVRIVDQSRAGRMRLTLDGLRLYGLSPEATPARVRVTLQAADPVALAPGDRVSVLAALSPPGGPVEPGAFNFARASFFVQLGGVGVARSRVAALPAAGAPGFFDVAAIGLAAARRAVGEALRDRMAGEAGAFAAAIAVGDRSGLPREAVQALRDSNLAHLLAISGLHMAITCGLVFFTIRLLLAMSPHIALRAPIKSVAAMVALCAGLAYLAMSGASVATQRAFVMVAVALVAVIAGRPAFTLRALALAAFAVLATAPESVLSVGFQMSFAATAALVAGYETAREAGWFAPGRGAGRRIALYAAGVALTSVIAGLATAPFAAYHFNRLTTYGLPANLAATPLMGFVVAPALALSAAFAPFGLEAWPLRAAAWGIDAILAVARATASAPDAVRLVETPAPLALWMVTLGGLWLTIWRGWLRWLGAAPLLIALVLWIAPPPRPAVLIAAGGGAVGVLTDAGRAVDRVGRARFSVESWLRRDADPADGVTAEGRGAFGAGRGWRVAQIDGLTVQVLRARRVRRDEIIARCAASALVILPNARAPLRPDGCALLDARDLAPRFGRSARVEGERWILEPHREPGAGRPWGLSR